MVGIGGQADGDGNVRALTIHQADQVLPEAKLARLTDWSVEAVEESGLASWGWSLSRDPEVGRHWMPRARGVARGSERGYRFRGRRAALSELADWITSEQPRRTALVVTGSPGVGKSAVPGRIVTSADGGIAAVLPPEDDAVRAPVGSVACAVHANLSACSGEDWLRRGKRRVTAAPLFGWSSLPPLAGDTPATIC